MMMTQIEEEKFVEGAFQALIDRGVASKDMFTPSFCIDVSQNEVSVDRPDTWQLCQFDQTAFDWEAAGYIDDHGVVKGEKIMPDFKSLLELYFYGKYDREYEHQLRERGEEEPDYGYYIHQQQKRPA